MLHILYLSMKPPAQTTETKTCIILLWLFCVGCYCLLRIFSLGWICVSTALHPKRLPTTFVFTAMWQSDSDLIHVVFMLYWFLRMFGAIFAFCFVIWTRYGTGTPFVLDWFCIAVVQAPLYHQHISLFSKTESMHTSLVEGTAPDVNFVISTVRCCPCVARFSAHTCARTTAHMQCASNASTLVCSAHASIAGVRAQPMRYAFKDLRAQVCARLSETKYTWNFYLNLI